MKDPVYLKFARSQIGLKEVTGKNDHPLIFKWWNVFGLGWLYGQPWCGLFAGYCMKQAGITPPKNFFRAKAWLDFGNKIPSPVHGCIVVFERKGGGHVGFVVGKDRQGRILVLGANQNNQVSVAPFDTTRVAGYRTLPNVISTPLQVIANEMTSSENEA